MNHDEGRLRTPSGHSLFYQSWMPANDCTAILLIVHGLAEHSGRYEHIAAFFVDRGYALFAVDHVGHGKSDGDRCHIEHFSEYTDGIALLLECVRDKCPGIPVVLVGHSMGGLIATRILIDHQGDFAASVVSGAAIQPVSRLSSLQRLMLRFFSRVLPRLRVLSLEASKVSRDPAVVDRYRQDPLVFNGKVTARLAEQLISTMSWLEGRLGAIELPMLILHGSDDEITPLEGSKMLHREIKSRIKTLTIYEGLYHEIYNEPEQEEVMSDVANWLAFLK